MIKLYTDGSCIPNPGTGGWAFICEEGTNRFSESGYEKNTTNNRMELMAVIQALLHITQHTKPITVYTDSTYVQKGMTEWMENWKKKGFKKVKNPDLWKILNTLSERYTIQWIWVKAHNGHLENEQVDNMAKKAAIEQYNPTDMNELS